MYELEKKNLKHFSEYFTKTLRPSLIKLFMTEYLDSVTVERILSEEKTSVTEAVKLLFDSMYNLDKEGWFQAFIDNLHASGYTGLYEAVKEWDFHMLEELQEHRKLLEKIEPSITKHIKPSEVLTHMTDTLKSEECEEIRAVEVQRGPIAASEMMVRCLLRSDKSNWFKMLKMALEQCELTQALHLLEPNDNGKVQNEQDEGMDTSETISTVFQFEEDSESDSTLLKSADTINVPETSGVQGGERKLRKYQEELSAAAINGQNTIICAPTGCGKTVVALAICEKHLKQFPGKAKIVFLATKVDVYDQQYKLFKEHFFSKDPSISVIGMCGDMEGMSVDLSINNHDIVVMTAQILVNALNNGEVTLELLTLILLDECHNTTGKHPYNNIMTRYLDTKLTRTTCSLPQIVGLTASVGIGNFKSQPEAESNIVQLCANLDTRAITTVTKHLDELRSYVHKPEKQFFDVPQRTSDPFIRIIKQIMSTIEEMAQNTFDIGSLSNLQTREYGSQVYEQWIVSVQKRCRVLQIQKNPEEESRICRALFNYTEHLRKYNDALIITEDARTKDALDYLDGFFEQVRNAGFDETERKLTEFFDSQRSRLLDLATNGPQNPKLEELKFILEEEYHNNPQTRTVLFVRTRALADAMKKWIEDTDSLSFLNPGVLIGKGRKSNSNNSGMTLNNMKGVLETFKNSDTSKILVATSVADEGIDIPQCNLVVMYEYVGNVVKMVQVRGRGRAQDSRCFLISSCKERIEKERMNMLKEKMVEEAVTRLQSHSTDLSNKVDVLQRDDKARRDFIRSSPDKPKTQASYDLLCGKCKTFACLSDDLRVLQKTHHISLDHSIFDRCTAEPHKKPKSFDGVFKKEKLLCAKCKFDWGIIASYLNIQDLPVLKIESFTLQDRDTKKQFCFRRWRDVTFAIQEFDMTEITPESWPLREDL